MMAYTKYLGFLGCMGISMLTGCASESESMPEREFSVAAQQGGTCSTPDRASTRLNVVDRGTKPAGKFAVVVENDPTISDHTIFRPETLGEIQHPILAWGNGGCMKNIAQFTELLIQFAAQGIVVVADGKPGGSGNSAQDGKQLLKAIDWAEAESKRPCSKYYGKLDVTKIAVSGQSCGGLMALNVSGDKRITTSMPLNSGLFARNPNLYRTFHAPTAIINGGPNDIAYANGKADFDAITNIPIVFANLPVGHMGTYSQDNAGEIGKAAIGWLRWHLFDDQGATGKGMFVGSGCALCKSPWTIQWKNTPQ